MRAKRVDQNQKSIVTALREAGCNVFVTSMVGGGFPDLCVSYRNRTYLVEVKDGSKWASHQKLTLKEQEFHDTWQDHVYIINSIKGVEIFMHSITCLTKLK